MAKVRVTSVDALRGLVMIIMALDHTRDYFTSANFNPEDLTKTTAAYFFTRWITHFCAPTFMFTAGIGAYLWMRRGRTTGELSRFLWTRGVWLVILELTVLRFEFYFKLFDGPVLLTILWAIGWSMIALAALVHIPIRPLAVISVAAIALHNLTDRVQAAQFGGAAWVWNILHQQGVFLVKGVPVVSGYPLVPWMFVMALGYCFGTVLTMEAGPRRRWTIRLGAGLTLAFVAIRALNVYGDPFRWSTAIPGMTVISFLRCTKYPPSLDFLLMTLGPSLLVLAFFDGREFKDANPLIVFGRVPMFYFLGHFLLIHLLTIPAALASLGRADIVFNLPPFGRGYGYPLAGVYAVWIGVVVIMYPLCLWYARLKQRRNDWWLGYL